jgi:hypothetical protein
VLAQSFRLCDCLRQIASPFCPFLAESPENQAKSIVLEIVIIVALRAYPLKMSEDVGFWGLVGEKKDP